MLLKNDPDHGLPFTPGKKLVVVGTDAANQVAIMMPSNYNADNICPTATEGGRAGSGVDVSCLTTIWEALNTTNTAAGGTFVGLTKSGKDSWDNSSITAAVALAKSADNVLVFISNAEDEGGEGHDRSSIALAPDQMKLATAVFDAVVGKPGIRSALMMINGGVIAFDGLREAPPAILDLFMPGAFGAQAVAETVWGQNVPSGKLPFTMYFSNYTDGLDIDDMSMQAGPGRTYRYFDGPVIYPFGHGLSYTSFELNWSPAPPQQPFTFTVGTESAIFSVNVTNTGSVYAADEVVLAFFKPDAASIPSLRNTDTPVVVKQLFDFQKVHLAPGASTTLHFIANATALGLADSAGHTSLHPGRYTVVFSRGCVRCSELVAPVLVDAARPIRLKSFRQWW